tara:strand:- start:9047 stop:9982 length:936 start_codon:yes stop_codon:yes gene_type:complete
MRMKSVRLVAIVLACVFTVNASAARKKKASGPLRMEGARVEIYKTIGDVNLEMHIFEPGAPQKGEKRPAIVFFFGGGWRGGTPRQFEQQCRYLATRGMVAMTAEYRVLSKHGTKAVTCVRDGKSAIRWVRANAKRLGVDPKRIAAGGGSAGGHVAGCTGSIKGFEDEKKPSSLPNAMVLFNPAMVLAKVKGENLPFDEDKMRDFPKRMGVDPVKLSPFHNVTKGAPPTLTHHGKGDTVVLYRTAELFHEKMLSLGNRSELAGYEDQPHGFFNFGRNENAMFAATMKRTDKFLQSLGYLSGPDAVDEFLTSK